MFIQAYGAIIVFDIFKNISYQIISPKAAAQSRYEAFRELLEKDRLAHEAMAELEEIYYQKRKVDFAFVASRYKLLAQTVSGMIDCLGRMAPSTCKNLQAYFNKVDFYCRFALAPPEVDTSPPYILPLHAAYPDDKSVGGKGYNLALLMFQLGIPVPQGFVVSTSAYQYILEVNNLRAPMDAILSQIDIYCAESLSIHAKELSQLIDAAQIPASLIHAFENATKELQHKCGSSIKIAVRSSAIGEDSKISFAGQYQSVLNVTKKTFIDAYKKVLRSKFSPQALFYRIHHGFADHTTPMAVLVLEMIDSDAAGVILTSDRGKENSEAISIHYVQGQGEQLVSGNLSPTTILVDKDEKQKISNRGVASGEKRALQDSIILQLANLAMQIEYFYGAPQEIEWCIDRQGVLYILQSRYYQVHKAANDKQIDTSGFPTLFKGGERAASGAATGEVYILQNLNQLDDIPDGAILVTRTTPPSLARVCHRLAAVIADEGSVADHFASVAREFNIPTLVKTGNCTKLLAQKQVVTVWADGQAVYSGALETLISQIGQNKDESTPLWHPDFGIAISFISPLHLTDPADPAFISGSCRSHHDIIRYVHENGVKAMFGLADRVPLRKGGARLLNSSIPLQLYLLDIDGGFHKASKNKTVELTEIKCKPLLALWEGLIHKGVTWQERSHFDWDHYDQVIMAGGVVSPKSMLFASYAVISLDYLNLNMRFGYHFALLDTLLSPGDSDESYIFLRFAGGGGGMEGKHYRLIMIEEILKRLQFTTKLKGDMLEARYTGHDNMQALEQLNLVGRLLGATRIMDMILADEAMAAQAAEDFMNGKYNFSKE